MSHIDESLFTRNLDLLHRHHPVIHALLTQGAESIGEIFISPSGKPNFRARTTHGQDVIFHDQPDPETESHTYLERVTPTFTGVVIMIGMGLGYSPRPLSSNEKAFAILSYASPALISSYRHCEPLISLPYCQIPASS